MNFSVLSAQQTHRRPSWRAPQQSCRFRTGQSMSCGVSEFCSISATRWLRCERCTGFFAMGVALWY